MGRLTLGISGVVITQTAQTTSVFEVLYVLSSPVVIFLKAWACCLLKEESRAVRSWEFVDLRSARAPGAAGTLGIWHLDKMALAFTLLLFLFYSVLLVGRKQSPMVMLALPGSADQIYHLTFIIPPFFLFRTHLPLQLLRLRISLRDPADHGLSSLLEFMLLFGCT